MAVAAAMAMASIPAPAHITFQSSCRTAQLSSGFASAATSCSLSSYRSISGGIACADLFNSSSSVVVAKRGGFRLVVTNNGKKSLGCTKSNKPRKTRARAQGFRARMRTRGGRRVLSRRRKKGRKVLCTQTHPFSGKRS